MTVTLLDIDDRFEYLPGFRHFDLNNETDATNHGPFQMILFDPPYFGLEMQGMLRVIQSLSKDSPSCHLLVCFRRREEHILLRAFESLHLRPTNFAIEYARVKSTKWTNYGLYANCDLIGIKRTKGK